MFLPEHKARLAEEMRMMSRDLDRFISEEEIKLTGDLLRVVIALAQINTHIWYNEARARNAEDQDFSLLRLTHGLNGIRNRLCNRILSMTKSGDRAFPKVDCLASEFSQWDLDILSEKT